MKAHTIAENLVLPAARILVRNLIGEKEVGKLNSVSLSNDMRRRIHGISDKLFGNCTTQVLATTRPRFVLPFIDDPNNFIPGFLTRSRASSTNPC